MNWFGLFGWRQRLTKDINKLSAKKHNLEQEVDRLGARELELIKQCRQLDASIQSKSRKLDFLRRRVRQEDSVTRRHEANYRQPGQLFHGGCHHCENTDLGRCGRCKYKTKNWDLPNLNTKHGETEVQEPPKTEFEVLRLEGYPSDDCEVSAEAKQVVSDFLANMKSK